MTEFPEDKKREAFRLFEDGKYQESLLLCTALLESEKDSAIEVLAATNLYNTGRLEDAEVFFRDLARKMPDSSYVHSYLAKVLEGRGDEGAIAEYATAVHLDPGNQDALRSYAEYLIGHRDYRGALPVLRRLLQAGKNSSDRKSLMRALIEAGESGEALAIHAAHNDPELSHEYLDALVLTGDYRDAFESGLRLYHETGNPDIQRTYLDALARYDLPAALEAYAGYVAGVAGHPHAGILCDYILLLKAGKQYEEALARTRNLLSCDHGPAGRLLECELLAELGKKDDALAAYEAIIRDELAARSDPDVLSRIICRYRRFLVNTLPIDEATQRLLDNVSKDVNVASLLETARFFADLKQDNEARSWYYRAYRADFLAGGPSYARFLSDHGDERECEKVMLYILSNVRKGSDLIHIAAVILDDHYRMYRFRRLMEQLIKKLSERRTMLDSEGLELLSIAFFIIATNALEEADYAGCKYSCLCGMDVIPHHSRTVRLEDYLRLIRECKEQSVADRPVMQTVQVKERVQKISVAQVITDQLGLSGQEQKVVAFLRSHRKASEMDLRTLLGTRRVVGMVNRIIQKAASEGLSLIEKKGIGEDGEIYEYTGT
ncbi:tetratricopeptide repeat protein [uncultured Methanoregula sp.]|uniref:tetratricopeptide repeat protein n=1 Tax=uncultured Methanoregula sp. TaxID=1005933 RepID=UPI002AAB9B97|nr:tetratricopeptide repeat protein [uncultured Methanoregula sp.]